MTLGEKQLGIWRGDFGKAYLQRNQVTEERVRQRVSAFAAILPHLNGAPAKSILEVGANIGLNLRALAHLTDADLHAVEPFGDARKALIADKVVPETQVHDAAATSLPFADASIDLVFTSTVLIHVPDEALATAMREIHRVSRRWILCMEYFSPVAQTITYRGHGDLLFKRDYGGLWLDNFPDLEYVADGFFWKRMTGLDDVNWWLFCKAR